MTERVKLTWLVEDGNFFISASDLLTFFEGQHCDKDDCPIYINLAQHLHNLQNSMQGLPTTGDFKCKYKEGKDDTIPE